MKEGMKVTKRNEGRKEIRKERRKGGMIKKGEMK
jgi:hypothetical protein